MKTDKIELRVFIEGVLVPHVSSVSVSSGTDEETTATITMPPAPRLETEKLIRARVHIFYSDIRIRQTYPADEWPLLFEGEIVGDSLQKTPSSRNLVLQCAGYYTYFRQVLLSYYDPSQADLGRIVNAAPSANFLGNKKVELDLALPGANAKGKLAEKMKTATAGGYSGAVIEMFRESLGSNEFFVQAQNQLNLMGRFITPKDPNVEKLINRDSLVRVLSRDYSSYNGNISVMEVMKDALSVLHYRIISNPSPRFLKSTSKAKQTTTDFVSKYRLQISETISQISNMRPETADKLSNIDESISDSQIESIVQTAFDFEKTNNSRFTGFDTLGNKDETLFTTTIQAIKSLRDAITTALSTPGGQSPQNQNVSLSQFICIPDTRFAAIPRCNVIFPRQQTSWSMSRDHLKEPTRMFVGGQVALGANTFVVSPPSIFEKATKKESTGTSKQDNLDVKGFCAPIIGQFTISSGFYSRSLAIYDYQEKFHRGIDIPVQEGTEVVCVKDGVVKKALKVDGNKNSAGFHVIIDHGSNVYSKYFHLKEGSIKVSEGQKISTGTPIAQSGSTGNPGSKDAEGKARKYPPHLHFELWIGNEAIDPLPMIEKVAGPPSSGIFTGKKEGLNASSDTSDESTVIEVTWQSEVQNGSGNQHWKYLTPEERIKGIIPVFNNEIAISHQGFYDTSTTAESRTEAARGQVQAYIQHATDAELLWMRYMTRSAQSIGMPFNPMPVAGFPALIVDGFRSVIAMIMSVDHNIAVGGGSGTATTTISIAACRYFDEGDPYFYRGGSTSGEKVFPVYYNDDMIPTNSAVGYTEDSDWPAGSNVYGKQDRPVDRYFQLIFGCPSIPYQYAERKSSATGETVAYNCAVAGVVGSKSTPRRTIVGTYERFQDVGDDEADLFVRDFTKREVVTEKELMVNVLQSKQEEITLARYSSGPFRGDTQKFVIEMNFSLSGIGAKRG